MGNEDSTNFFNSISSREAMIRYLDGYSSERLEELDERKAKNPLTKSYLIEHTGDSERIKPIDSILNNNGIDTEIIDDNLFRISDRNLPDNMGFLEVLTPRYFTIYTSIESKDSDKWINKLVMSSPELDHVWLSGLTFNVLWDKIIQSNHPNRYVKIGFLHDSIYQIDNECSDKEDDEDIPPEEINIDEVYERRASKISLVDKISVVQEKLIQLQKIYSPLYAINQLRFPSSSGGGHDFFDNGKVTNRSGNFRDHRNHVLFVQRIYENLMDSTENKVWYSIQKESAVTPGAFQKLIGAPVSIIFSEPLNNDTFEYWIKSTFDKSRENRFRLWGNPIRLGPNKVHVYGVDRHLWQQIFLELTTDHLMAIIPQGTCGNTVHRLVTNIQRYIDPAASVYIGDINYSDLVEQSSKGVVNDRRESNYLQ